MSAVVRAVPPQRLYLGEVAYFRFYAWCGLKLPVEVYCNCGGATPILWVTPHIDYVAVRGRCAICGADLTAVAVFVVD